MQEANKGPWHLFWYDGGEWVWLASGKLEWFDPAMDRLECELLGW